MDQSVQYNKTKPALVWRYHKGQAFRYNLFLGKYRKKRINTAILNAKNRGNTNEITAGYAPVHAGRQLIAYGNL